IRATDLPLVGGKGANLGEMAYAGFPVPPGFCVTTRAFDQFMRACPVADDLYALLDTVTADDVQSARTVGEQVRKTLAAVPIPPQIVQSVHHAWQALGTDHAYAVRSSATAEDLPDASFAGQQDTYLNIIGQADLLDAVRRCWVSLFTDRAILYRCQNDFAHRDVQLSVAVQQMVMSESSGILFTADPLTGHRHTASIDASFGLGEALVSGLVSPDAYRVDKRTGVIIDRQIADKEIAIFPNKEGGTRQEKLSDAQRSQTVLTDAQILALARMGSQIEAHYAKPQDIEWALAEGKLYLLQARPITSLYPIDGLGSPDGTLHIYFNMGYQQNMTNVMSPLGLSGIRCLIPVGRATEDEIESRFMLISGGRAFADLTQLLRHPLFRKGVFGMLAQFDALAPQTLQLAMQRPEFQRPHGLSPSLSAVRGGLHMAGRILRAVGWEDLTGLVHKVNGIVDQQVAEVGQSLAAAPVGEAKIQAIIDVIRPLFQVVMKWAPHFAAGEMAQRLLARLTRSWADPADVEACHLGLPGNAVTEMNLALGDVAELARRSPALSGHFARLGEDSHTWLAEAAQIEGSAPFMQAWAAFLARYGSRGSAEIDLMPPRWIEEPLPLLKVLTNYLQKQPGSHRIQHQSLVHAREAATIRILAQADRGPFGWLRGRLVRRLLHVISEAGVLREHHKFMMVQIIWLAKQAVKETAAHLVERGQLAQADQVWYLSFPELLALCRGEAPELAAQIPGRRADLLRFKKLVPPMVITSDGESPVVKYVVADAPVGALIGSPVSPGVVEGTVRVIRDPQTETLNPGEILVAPFTDPGWTPLFINAGGLIMEIGGIMTHGSVVAREYGIPAIVGVRGATTALQTGQRVRVDGNRGVIEVL
ncbi:MAG: phosphoenolpyruvate synthase, partial [Caldilineaceae bacterium]|nr:phosphoenolpyruvate synthase [Caldilineaceae bacterium]